jgi:hypothetical protein
MKEKSMAGQTTAISKTAQSGEKRHGLIPRILVVSTAFWLVVTAAYLLFVWPWMRGWGATRSEQKAMLPGDDIVYGANLRTTKAITIQAPPEVIYPWLLQIGVDRGGMYSYQWLENLFGLKVQNVDHIVPAYQEARPGDFWRFTPEDYLLNPGPGLYVRELIPNQAVLLTFGLESKPDDKPIYTWQFVLEPQPAGSTRLLLRSNMAIKPELPIKLTYFVQFIMERKMLLTLRDKVETQQG